jgi:heat shock protein HtpX
MWLQLRMYLLSIVLFGILYAIIAAAGSYLGIDSFLFYGLAAIGLILVQYMIGPKIVEWSMKVRYVSEKEEPKLHKMVAEIAEKAGTKKPRVGISEMQMPNAFAFGRWKGDARICVTRGIMNLLSDDEMKAVIGHEMTHVTNRDVTIITLLSVIPMLCWWLSRGALFSSTDRERGSSAVLIGLFAFILYFVTNLLVLYASRIREYSADKGSVKLGNSPSHLASALYKLVYGNAKADRNEVKQAQGYRAFFVNDPSTAANDFSDLKALDKDMSGTIDANELESIRNAKFRISKAERVMEVLSTHPNMLKRIQNLSTLA